MRSHDRGAARPLPDEVSELNHRLQCGFRLKRNEQAKWLFMTLHTAHLVMASNEESL